MKVKSKAMQARLDYARRVGRPVPLSEVAAGAEVDRMALTRLEQGKTERYDGDLLARLCKYYDVGIADLLEYDPNDIRTPGTSLAVYPA